MRHCFDEIVGLCVRIRGHGFVGNGMAFFATAIEELHELENVCSELQRKGHDGSIKEKGFFREFRGK